MSYSSLNGHIREIIQRTFFEAADEDYLIARYAYFADYRFHFWWNSAQAIEKYLKAILLFNGEKVESNHDLISLFERAKKFLHGLPTNFDIVLNHHAGCLRTDLDGNPINHDSNTYSGFLLEANDFGDPNVRYRMHSLYLEQLHLTKLDFICFYLRLASAPELLDKKAPLFSFSKQSAFEISRGGRVLKQWERARSLDLSSDEFQIDHLLRCFMINNYAFVLEEAPEAMSGIPRFNNSVFSNLFERMKNNTIIQNRAESEPAQLHNDSQLLLETIEWIERKFPNGKSTAKEFEELSEKLREIQKRFGDL